MSERPHAEPVFIVQLEFTDPQPLTLRLSDRYIPPHGALGECLPFVMSWGSIEERLNPLDGGGAPATFDFVLTNTRPIAGLSRFSDILSSYVFEFAKVTVFHFDADDGIETARALGVFYVEDATEIDERLIRLRASDITLVLEEQSPVTVIGRDEFPQAASDVIGQTIPRLIGRLEGVPLRFVEAGQLGSLATDIDTAATEITVTGGENFTELTFMIGGEILVATGRKGATFTGCSRGQYGTNAADSSAGTEVSEILPSYLAVLGEHDSRFLPSISNVKVDGGPVNALVTAVLQDLGIPTAPGKRFIGVRFTPIDVANFHLLPGTPQGQAVATLVSGTVTEGTSSVVTRTISATGATSVAAGATLRKLDCTVALNSGSGAVNWYLERRQGTGPWTTLASQLNVSAATVNTKVVDDRLFPGSGDDQIRLRVHGLQGAASASLKVTFNSYTVTFGTGQGSGSTAARVIGEVTCDMVGVKDDSYGTISGTPAQLLDNPADAIAYLLTRCYPSSAEARLHPKWSEAREALAKSGISWAALIGFDGAPRFSTLRKQMAEQSRALLMTEAGDLLLRYLPDGQTADLTLDCDRDVWAEAPAIVSRSSRTQVYNRLTVKAGRQYSTGDYLYIARVEDLSQPGLTKPQETTLELPWVREAIIADRLAYFWLGRWKRPALQVDGVGWNRLLPVLKGDHVAFQNHPVLAGQGGESLLFRIIGRSYLLGDDNPNRVRISAVESATV